MKSWKWIAKELRESMGCGCCGDRERLYDAKIEFGKKMEAEKKKKREASGG